MPSCCFRLSDGEFVRGAMWGCGYDPATEIVLELPDYPDQRIQKLNTATNQLVTKSAAEIRAYDDAQVQAQAIAGLDNNKALKALAIVLAQSTGQTVAQVRTAFIAAYKNL